MSKKILESLSLSESALVQLAKQTEKLTNEGVQLTEEHSGELNFAGCASGYCQAWD